MTPVIRKPGPRPGVKLPGYGKTGKSLINEIKERLSIALSKDGKCDAILVIDDLDCHNETIQKDRFIKTINSLKRSKEIEKFIAFASPELEAWIIADWDNSVARHYDFRGRHNQMRHWLSTVKNVSFASPESFGIYNQTRDTCEEKLSNAIIESTMRTEEDRKCSRYSKALHTPELLLHIDPLVVKDKCPLFRQLYFFLYERCHKA